MISRKIIIYTQIHSEYENSPFIVMQTKQIEEANKRETKNKLNGTCRIAINSSKIFLGNSQTTKWE